MRMIDADKAIEVTWKEPSYTDPLNVLTEVRDRLKKLPTIEAIPVQWIEKHFGSLRIAQMIIESWRAENAV